jgi:hypothetical protein
MSIFLVVLGFELNSILFAYFFLHFSFIFNILFFFNFLSGEGVFPLYLFGMCNLYLVFLMGVIEILPCIFDYKV